MEIDVYLLTLLAQAEAAKQLRLQLCEQRIRQLSTSLSHGEFVEILDRVYHEMESAQETATGNLIQQWSNRNDSSI